MKYFGTDGIRGTIDNEITSNLCYKMGKALGIYIIKNNLIKRVIIGKDTRLSGDLILYSLVAGLLDTGINVDFIGIVPTACVSYLARENELGLAIMITASHNSWEMNGIKVFNKSGYKLKIEDEMIIEYHIDNCDSFLTKEKGSFTQNFGLVEKYINKIMSIIDVDLCKYNIAIDCANGSNYTIAYRIFKQLNANIIPICCENNGKLINYKCGAQNIDNLQKQVLNHYCDFGFAFDGDADRLVVVLNDGSILDGDDLLYIFAYYLNGKNKLNESTVVGTIMTNSGMEKALNEIGLKLNRVDVGDRNVIEHMLSNNFSIGGEPSGHICLHEFNTTCDALFNSLFLMKIIVEDEVNIKDLLLNVNKSNQIIKNIQIDEKLRKEFDVDKYKEPINKIVEKNGNNIRVVVRPSGTESVLRIMVEGESEDKNLTVLSELITLFTKKKQTKI